MEDSFDLIINMLNTKNKSNHNDTKQGNDSSKDGYSHLKEMPKMEVIKYHSRLEIEDKNSNELNMKGIDEKSNTKEGSIKKPFNSKESKFLKKFYNKYHSKII